MLNAGIISPLPLLSSLLSLALLTWAICMDCSIRWPDSRADERKREKTTTDSSREAWRIMIQHPKILTEQFPLFLCLFLSLSLSYTHTDRCLMRLSCLEIGWSISFSLSFLSVSPPSIKLLLLLLSFSVSPRHSVPFQCNSKNYNPWIYWRM